MRILLLYVACTKFEVSIYIPTKFLYPTCVWHHMLETILFIKSSFYIRKLDPLYLHWLYTAF